MSTPELSLSLRCYGESPGSHSHAHFQVLWGWQGVLELEMEGRGHRVGPGSIAVVAPGDRHDFQAVRSAGARARCFVLDGDDGRLAPLAGQVLQAGPSSPWLLQFLADQPPGAGAWSLAAPLLLQTLGDSRSPAGPGKARPIDWPRLQAWVDARLHEPLGVADLAREVHLGPAQFTARCRERWGVAPQAWLRERRLAAALRWRAQGLGVAQTAQRCGYRSPSALTAALKRRG